LEKKIKCCLYHFGDGFGKCFDDHRPLNISVLDFVQLQFVHGIYTTADGIDTFTENNVPKLKRKWDEKKIKVEVEITGTFKAHR